MTRATANPHAAILNAGPGDWAFAAHAEHLSRVLGVPVVDRPARLNYVLACDEADAAAIERSFVPFPAVRLASDKRLLAEAFARAGVPTPTTHLANGPADVARIVASDPRREWCLKYPTGCGGAGHRLVAGPVDVPADWPRPLVVQAFVRMPRPEVYRLYAAGGETFGWNVRRYADEAKASPWVAHARGARYEVPGPPPPEAVDAARAALAATGLLDSFGCADLLLDDGRWLVLEVGTDGVYNHVDRSLGLPNLEREIDERLAAAFEEWVAPACTHARG